MCAHSRGLHEWVTHGVNEFTPFFAPLSRDLSSLSITVISDAKRTGSRRQVSQSNSTLRMILGDGSGVRIHIRTMGKLGEGETAIKNRVGAHLGSLAGSPRRPSLDFQGSWCVYNA